MQFSQAGVCKLTERTVDNSDHPSLDDIYYQRHTLKVDPKELAIQYAIEDFPSGAFTSQRKAAAAYGVAESTLHGQLKGQQPHAIVIGVEESD